MSSGLMEYLSERLSRPRPRAIWATLVVLGVLVGVAFAVSAEDAADYFPPPGESWEQRAPEAVGLDPERLDAAVRYALDHETSRPIDLEAMMRERLAGQPYNEILGPMKPRGGANGLVLRHGYIVAEWGDTRRVDMTFSATKSYLATIAGLAFDQGLISDLDARVGESVSRRWLRIAPQCPHHVASSVAADQRVAGDALGQARHRRPTPRSGPSAANAGNLLGVQ